MALIKCPECDLQVSDKALACPHCGYPLQQTKKTKKTSFTKRKRLPNGFGQISKIKSNLRAPYRAMVTIGKKSDGKPVCKILGYYASYNEAYEVLVEYHKNPYDLDKDITVAELFEKWTAAYFSSLNSDSSSRTINSAWAYCSSVYAMNVRDLRARHIKGCMENGYRIATTGSQKGNKIFASASTKARIKSLFNLMLDYALEYEIVDRNYARTFELTNDIIIERETEKIDHISFTVEEMNTLWSHVDDTKYVDWILIQCYMGWRPQELATIRLDEVHLDQWYMQAGMKTPAGKQRIVPIHSKIKRLVQKNYDFALSIGSKYLLNAKGQTHSGSWKLTYDKYAYRFNKVIETLQLDSKHRPHDPRKTFITNAKKAGVDEYSLKRMAGHRIEDITESVYTERDLEWLRSDIEKL